ncbi:adenosylcobinamide-phosphate synthase CbiB [Gluconobacter wancherniae]|uniref:adenosylcobinamide-phosphate synthase CbiB n=1 Tax=Gluconobacter wancherniae TaxID=1307955 RepID=UPI001B8C64C3|nr:adenosylcobinamide-phosphate synthase CbiB [Gluconobacter wancherniae]MBS1093743.1 cobalamin biosynthesis protein CobD [Gluconobacter wancherniae]
MSLSYLPSVLPIACLASAVEAIVGYPEFLIRAIGHPVMWIGGLISALDRKLNRPDWSFRQREAAGMLALLVIVLVPALIAACALRLAESIFPTPLVFVLEVLVTTSMIAQRSLWTHVRAVHDALETGGLAEGRKAVSMIVGRDPSTLDKPAVIRAAIESLAENFSDGVIAPIFWTAIGGLTGATAYKAINTADSMIGHLTPRHSAFGRASAKCDDAVNIPASRLAALWIILAALTYRQTNARAAIDAVFRDAKRHRSPNAGWPEAAMAGALGLRLAGPRVYGGVRVDDPWMGNGRTNTKLTDLAMALRLYRRACVLQGIALAIPTILMMDYWLS